MEGLEVFSKMEEQQDKLKIYAKKYLKIAQLIVVQNIVTI